MTQVNGGHMQVVAIGMQLAGEHVTHIESLQAALDALHLFEGIHLKSGGGQGVAYFLWREVKINIFLQPLVRYIHISILI